MSTLDETDLLGHWLAHHLADLITRAEAAEGEGANEARQEAVDLILRLWDHRSTLPSAHRPLANFEPALSALAKLDGPYEPRQHAEIFGPGQAPKAIDVASVDLLRHALKLEEGIIDLIRDIVSYAARLAEDKERDWINASEHLEEDAHFRARRALHHFNRGLHRKIELLAADIDPEEVSRSDEILHAITQLEASLQAVRIALHSSSPSTEGSQS